MEACNAFSIYIRKGANGSGKKGYLREWNLSRGEVASLPDINNNKVFVIVFKTFD